MHKRFKVLLAGFTFLTVLYVARLPCHSNYSKADRSSADLIEVTVATLLDTGDGAVVLLKEARGDRFLPIAIGDPETRAIALGLERHRHPERARRLDRPLTHNLLLDIVAQLGGRVERIAVIDLRANLYYAGIYLKVSGRKEIKIDSRPSDAIALAITMENPAPIYVARDVMARSGKKNPNLYESEEQEKKKALRL